MKFPHKKAFTFIEIFYALAIISLLAIMFFYASIFIKDRVQNDIISSNIVKIVNSARSYMEENDMRTVNYKTLVESKAISGIKVVNGEKYSNIIIYKSGGIVSVKNAKGVIIEYKY